MVVSWFKLMEGTTSIGQLPTDGNFSQNVNMTIEPQQGQMSMPQSHAQTSMGQGQLQQQPHMAAQHHQQMLQGQSNMMTDQMRPTSPPQAIPNMGVNNGNQPVFINNGAPANNDPGIVQHLNKIHESNMMNNGSMELPSRDMPRGTFNMATDAEVQQNYINKQHPYIDNPLNINTLNNINNTRNSANSSNEAIYEELKLPIIVTLLYMISSTEACKNLFKNTFPFFFDDRDILKKSGIVTKSIIFGGMFLACTKLVQHFSNL